MTATPSGAVVRVKPAPNIYTFLLLVAIAFLAVTIGFVANDLMANYGFSVAELFTGQKMPPM